MESKTFPKSFHLQTSDHLASSAVRRLSGWFSRTRPGTFSRQTGETYRSLALHQAQGWRDEVAQVDWCHGRCRFSQASNDPRMKYFDVSYLKLLVVINKLSYCLGGPPCIWLLSSTFRRCFLARSCHFLTAPSVS